MYDYEEECPMHGYVEAEPVLIQKPGGSGGNIMLICSLIFGVIVLLNAIHMQSNPVDEQIARNVKSTYQAIKSYHYTPYTFSAHAPVRTSYGIPGSVSVDATCSSYTSMYHTDYAGEACQAAQASGIDPRLFVRQINQESGFNPNSGSSAGAVGIAQFLPSTAAGLGVDPYNPESALAGSAKLMSNYNQQYGNYAMALAAYNAGSGALHAAVTNCGVAWQTCLPAETQNYIAVIMG
jgi:soluble lytic murein transglycosylase-like protein